jgi:hypothetical protein
MFRMMGLADSETIGIPVGHRWIQSQGTGKADKKKPLISFNCAHCSAVFALQFISEKGAQRWVGSFQYFQDSCIESEARLIESEDRLDQLMSESE